MSLQRGLGLSGRQPALEEVSTATQPQPSPRPNEGPRPDCDDEGLRPGRSPTSLSELRRPGTAHPDSIVAGSWGAIVTPVRREQS